MSFLAGSLLQNINLYIPVVANCGGTLQATTVPGSISLPEFPYYPMQCVWNISAGSESSRINISISDNLEPWERSPYCTYITMIIYAGMYEVFHLCPTTDISNMNKH